MNDGNSRSRQATNSGPEQGWARRDITPPPGFQRQSVNDRDPKFPRAQNRSSGSRFGSGPIRHPSEDQTQPYSTQALSPENGSSFRSNEPFYSDPRETRFSAASGQQRARPESSQNASSSDRLMAMLRGSHQDPLPASAPSQESDVGFEDRIRNMITGQNNSVSDDNAQTATIGIINVLPVSEGRSTAPVGRRRRPTQNERRQGQSNRLDLSESITPNRGGGSRDMHAGGDVRPDQGSNWSPHYHRHVGSRAREDGFANDYVRAPHSPQDALNGLPSHFPVRDSYNGVGGQNAHAHQRGQYQRSSHPNQVNRGPAHSQAPSIPYGSTHHTHHNRSVPSDGRRLYDHHSSTFNNHTPLGRQADYLQALVTELVPQLALSLSEEQLHMSLHSHLSSIVRQAFQSSEDATAVPESSIRLECFGSLASGFGMHNSDMDLMLFYDDSPLEDKQKDGIPRMIEKVLLDKNHGARLLTRTRVPIIRFCSEPSPELLSALRAERAKWEVNKDLEDEAKSGDSGDNDGNNPESPRSPRKSDENGKRDEENTHDETGVREEASSSADEEEDSPQSPDSPNSAKKDAFAVGGPSKSSDGGNAIRGADVDPKARRPPMKKNRRKTRSQKKKTPSKNKEKEETKEGEEPKEPVPPPYKTDEERLQLYHQAIKEDWYSPEERSLIREFGSALHAANGTESDRLVSARSALDALPDILSRYREPRKRKQELEFPEGSGLLCDINFSVGPHSNPLGVHNTRMLRCYSMCDSRIKQMVVFVKGWAKQRNINKPYHGTLSSYGYVLMVLHYAINIADPPLAPNLQLLHQRNSATGFTAQEVCGEYDIRFWQDLDAIEAASQWEFGHNKQSIGSLLAGFFRYYAVQDFRGQRGFEWMKDVLSLRTHGGLLSKKEKGWTGKWTQSSEAEPQEAKPREITHRYLIAIEDPFEHAHNVGRPVMHHGIVAIREEFRRANQLIMSAGFVNGKPAGFFDRGVEHEREHRYFGPNPKFRKEKQPVIGPKNLVGEERKKALEGAANPSAEAPVPTRSGAGEDAAAPPAPAGAPEDQAKKARRKWQGKPKTRKEGAGSVSLPSIEGLKLTNE